MAREAIPMDVNHSPELLSLAQEVKRTGTARVLRADGEELAWVVPPKGKKRSRKGKPTSADDPFWRIIGMGRTEEPSDVSEHVDEFLAEWEVSNNRP